MQIGRRFLAGPLSASVKSIEVLNVLRFDRNEISVICRVVFREPGTRANRLFEDKKAEVQKLEIEKNGVVTYFIRRRLPKPPSGINPYIVYLSTPWTVEDGIGRATCLGSSTQIQEMMKSLEKAGIAYKIVSLANARFSRSSLLRLLTDKQREVISKAREEGYYDIPRKIRSDEMASKLGMRNATFVMHRRKAEKHLIEEIFSEY